MKKFLFGMVLSLACFTLAACGGGSSGGAAGGTGDTGGVSGISSMSDIDEDIIDPSAYDIQAKSIASSISQLGIKAAPGEVEGFSRAGCEALQMRNRIVREAGFPKMILCYMKQMATALGLEMGVGDYNYYNLGEKPGGPEDAGGSMSMKIAVKKVGDQVTMLMCESDYKVMEFVIDTSGGVYSGHMIDNWNFDGVSESRRLDFNADGPPEDFISAEFTQSFVSDTWGYGYESMIANATSTTVHGYHNDTYDGNNFSGSVFTKFNADEGSGRFSVSGLYLGIPVTVGSGYEAIDAETYEFLVGEMGFSEGDYICYGEEGPEAADSNNSCAFTDSGIESFTIQPSLNPSEAVAASSIFLEAVTAATLADVGSQPSIAFTNSDFSSCGQDFPTDGSGPSWTAIIGSGENMDVSACVAMEEQFATYEDGNGCEKIEDTQMFTEQSGSSKEGGGPSSGCDGDTLCNEYLEAGFEAEAAECSVCFTDYTEQADIYVCLVAMCNNPEIAGDAESCLLGPEMSCGSGE